MTWIVYAVFMTELGMFQGMQSSQLIFNDQETCMEYLDDNKTQFRTFLNNSIIQYLPPDMEYKILEYGCMPQRVGEGTET